MQNKSFTLKIMKFFKMSNKHKDNKEKCNKYLISLIIQQPQPDQLRAH